MKCQQCGAGWPQKTVAVYESRLTKVALCDDCLFAEMPRQQVTAVFAPGAQTYIAPDGSESPMPSYAS